jgi:hypothetical protein
MDRTLVPCPWYGSVFTSPREDPEMWECRYCFAVIPVETPQVRAISEQLYIKSNDYPVSCSGPTTIHRNGTVAQPNHVSFQVFQDGEYLS